MHLRCPHCQNPIEIADLPSGGEVTCAGCGSSFQIANAVSTGTWDKAPGKRLGKFEVLSTVGHGAFGTVVKAHDTELDRIVAIKIPRASNVGPDPDDLDRFLREARSVAQLRFPSIITMHEVGADNGTPYLVCDFVEGVTLADMLTGRGFTFQESAKLLAEVADALQYAHSLGVVHRDVKPSNIMIRPDGSPCVMDFGLAKRDAGEITMTIDGQILGTPAYMSPEQARGESHKVDGRSDVYSLGVILYQLLTGELPFRGNKSMLLHQVLHEEPKAPRTLNDKIPRDLETIALKAMAKEPHRRYASAKEMAEDLRRWLAGDPILARPVGMLESAIRWCRRKPMAAATLALGFLLVVVAIVVPIVIAAREAANAQALSDEKTKTQQALMDLKASEGKARDAEQIALRQAAELLVALLTKEPKAGLKSGDRTAKATAILGSAREILRSAVATLQRKRAESHEFATSADATKAFRWLALILEMEEAQSQPTSIELWVDLAFAADQSEDVSADEVFAKRLNKLAEVERTKVNHALAKARESASHNGLYLHALDVYRTATGLKDRKKHEEAANIIATLLNNKLNLVLIANERFHNAAEILRSAAGTFPRTGADSREFANEIDAVKAYRWLTLVRELEEAQAQTPAFDDLVNLAFAAVKSETPDAGEALKKGAAGLDKLAAADKVKGYELLAKAYRAELDQANAKLAKASAQNDLWQQAIKKSKRSQDFAYEIRKLSALETAAELNGKAVELEARAMFAKANDGEKGAAKFNVFAAALQRAKNPAPPKKADEFVLPVVVGQLEGAKDYSKNQIEAAIREADSALARKLPAQPSWQALRSKILVRSADARLVLLFKKADAKEAFDLKTECATMLQSYQEAKKSGKYTEKFQGEMPFKIGAMHFHLGDFKAAHRALSDAKKKLAGIAPPYRAEVEAEITQARVDIDDLLNRKELKNLDKEN